MARNYRKYNTANLKKGKFNKGRKKQGASALGGKDPIPWDDAIRMILLTAKESHRYKSFALLFATGIYAGLRIEDLKKVNKTHLRTRTIKVIAKKTGKLEYRVLSDEYYKLLRKCKISISGLRPGCLFGSVQNPDEPLTTGYINIILKEMCKKAEIDPSLDIASHSLRKTFGARIYHNAPADEKEEALIELNALFDHETIQETKKYIGLTKKRIVSRMLDL